MPRARHGMLEVTADFDETLSKHLPIEVRDRHHVFVASTHSGRRIRLREGLYAVSAVLEDGATVTESVHVKHRQLARVQFRSRVARFDLEAPLELPREESISSLFAAREPALGALGAMLDPDFASPRNDTTPAWVAAASANLSVTRSSDHRRVMARLIATGESPPWIVIASSAAVLHATLPLSSDPGCDECAIDIRSSDRTGRLDIEVILSPRRRIGGALYAMMQRGKVEQAVHLARGAAKLLADKYSDPVSAAFGGLILHRFGMLADRTPWIASLARAAPWLADAQVLDAALLSRRRDRRSRERGQDILLEVTRNPRMIFADAFSLAIMLLRRWPDAEGESERVERLEELSTTIAHYDFGATFATVCWASTELATMATKPDLSTPAVAGPETLVNWLAPGIVDHFGPREGPRPAPDLEAQIEEIRREIVKLRQAQLPPSAIMEAQIRDAIVNNYEASLVS